jgi:hypothetical protein
MLQLLGLFLIILLLMTRFSVELRVITEGLDTRSHIKFGIGKFFITVPQGVVAKMNQTIRRRNFGTLEAALRGVNIAMRSVDNLLQRIELLHLEVRIGTGDPFSTSLGVGGLWAIVGPVLTGLSFGNRLRSDPEVRIEPDYGQANVQIDLHCIFQFRVGQIIINELKRVMV